MAVTLPTTTTGVRNARSTGLAIGAIRSALAGMATTITTRLAIRKRDMETPNSERRMLDPCPNDERKTHGVLRPEVFLSSLMRIRYFSLGFFAMNFLIW